MNNSEAKQLCFLPAMTRHGYFTNIVIIISLFFVLILDVPVSFGEEFHNALSLQGYTGLLNTPNAEVTDEGKVYILFSNQKESQWRDDISRQENYIFSFGLFSFAEIGGRLTEATGKEYDYSANFKVRDLSANFKVKVPFIPQGYYLPDIAFGMQDVGGGARNLQTKYAVATKDLWRFRFSVGYGTGPDRMDGVFGGVEFKTFNWLYLLGEYDTKETNVGLRLVTPQLFGIPVNLQATAKTSLSYRPGSPEFGIGLQFPLGFNYGKNKALPKKEDKVEPKSPGVDPKKDKLTEGKPVPPGESFIQNDGGESLQYLRQKLTAGGFLNVRIGSNSDKTLLVVEYENSRYNHNELDGLGVVVGLTVDTVSSDFKDIRLIMKKKGIRILQVSAPLSAWAEFLNNPGKAAQLSASLKITPDVANDKTVNFIDGDANSSWLKSELLIYPGLKTFVGTDLGVFDYLLSIKPDYYLNLWKGAVLNARFDIPISWSKNFDDGHFFRSSRESSQADQLMLYQTIKLAPSVMLNVGGGMILHDVYGTLNELMWSPGNGNHRFLLKQAYLSSNDKQSFYQNIEVYLGSYRYYHAPLDLYLEGTAGQFLDQDRGFSLELKRFFGDTALSLFYKDSWTKETPFMPEEHVQMAGLQISIPLTPRRDMKPYIVQVKGNNDWTYQIGTKIATPGEANDLMTSIGRNPKTLSSLEHVYYNRDRLSEEYIRTNLPRLQDAYVTYLHKGMPLPIQDKAQPDIILNAAENFFTFLKNNNYAAAWKLLSENSRKAVLTDVWKESKKSGFERNKEELLSDFMAGGPLAKAYWNNFLFVCNPEIVLEQCKWEMGKIKQDEAEIILQYKKTEKPAILKMFRENNEWKVGLDESFGARKVNPF